MNDGIDWADVAQVFADALEQPPDQRRDLLDARCGDRADFRAAIERLLEAEEAADPRFLSGLDPASLEGVARAVDPPIERAGRYRIVREIGRGGMGQVFLAERGDGEFEQRVAIKLLKRGMDSDSILARFLRERQILARLEHPNIARLIDGGITEDGRPYFVMEHAEGEPITEYCDRRRLSIDERLDLFQTVCHAVEHAHRNLVVHRDLKPSNILVTADGRPKLLDFGIAKLLSAGEEADATMLTQVGARVLTPEYAAPEQLAGGPISTSTDVYGLGAVLYELLAGRRPFPPGQSLDAHVRRVTDWESPLRSAAMPYSCPTPPSAAASEAVRRRLRGDLDTIVLAALRREPKRRYATAEQLALDVRRHLDGQPVSARPDTWHYRSGKFVRRHRVGVAAALAFTILLVGYGITVTVQAGQIARQAAKTEQVKDFLASLFTHAMPTVTKGEDPTASELVEQGAHRVAVELADQPEIQAEMMTLLGQVYLTMGRYEAAIEQLQPALAIRRGLHAGFDEEAARTAQLLAEALHYEGRFADADTLLREVMELRRRLFGEASREVGAILNDLGDMFHTQGEFAAAEEHLRRALAIQITVTGDDSNETARARRDLGNALRDRGTFAEAESLYRRSLEVSRERFGQLDPVVARTQNELALLLVKTGEHDNAEALLDEIISVYATLYPQGHPMVGTTLRNLGVLRLRQGRPDEAAKALRDAVAMYQHTQSAESAFIPRAQRYLAEAALASGDIETAAATAEEAIARFRGMGLGNHPAVADALHTLDAARVAQEREPESPNRLAGSRGGA